MKLSSGCKKIGILIPTSSRNRSWKTFKETYLYNLFLTSFIKTYDKEHTYIIYLVIDDNDAVLSKTTEKETLLNFANLHTNISFKLISSSGIPPGHVTLMWNRAFNSACADMCDYFFQSGDDIVFSEKNWVNASIFELQKNNDIGLTGPIDWNRWQHGPNSRPGGARFIHTQSFVSRKHMEIFGFYFPEELKNWYCDDWMTLSYYPDFYYFIPFFCKNMGGSPRYKIIGSLSSNDPIRKKCFKLVSKHRPKIIDYAASNRGDPG
jgi:hypothetical protein